MIRIVVAILASLMVSAPMTSGASAKDIDSRVERTREPVMSDPAISVAGEVLSAAGDRIEDATVVLRAKIGGTQYTFGLMHNRDVLARTTTNADGKFVFEAIGLPRRMPEVIDSLHRGLGGVELIVWSTGTAMRWVDLKQFKTADPLTIKLEPEAPVHGEVVDDNGQPMGGATIRVYGLTKATTEMGGFFKDPGELNLNLSEVLHSVRTNKNGQFVVHNLPTNYRVFVGCTARDKTREMFAIDTDPKSDRHEIKSSLGARQTITIKRSPMKIHLTPAKDVLVKIIDHEGKPIADGAVQAITADRRFAGWESLDSDGIARIKVKDSGKYLFQYNGDPLQPRLGATATADVDIKGDPAIVEIRLPEFREITGQVVDAESGAPISGVYLSYVSGSRENESLDHAYCMGVTDEDGKFRLPALVGEGNIYFHSHVADYFPPIYQNSIDPRGFKRPSQAVNVPDSGDTAGITLKLARGLEVRGVVHGPAGKRVVGATVQGENVDRPFARQSTLTDEAGRFVLAGLSPQTKVSVTVRNQIGVAEHILEGKPEQPWDKTRVEDVELTLKPGIRLTGRVVKDGKPVSGILMKLHRLVPVERGARVQLCNQTETDADGNYSVAGLSRGDGYQFEIVAPEGMSAPGWRHQSPWSQKVPADAPDELHLPDAELVSTTQSLSGIVVDPKGAPVAGIDVSAKIVNGDFLSRPRTGPPPWTKTDEQGHFEISQLPEKPIELMAYKGNPKGGRIRYSSKLQPAMNQHDIRIVYDPALDKDVEDLDE